MQANPVPAAVTAILVLLGPVLVGINISPAPIFRDNAVKLRY